MGHNARNTYRGWCCPTFCQLTTRPEWIVPDFFLLFSSSFLSSFSFSSLICLFWYGYYVSIKFKGDSRMNTHTHTHTHTNKKKKIWSGCSDVNTVDPAVKLVVVNHEMSRVKVLGHNSWSSPSLTSEDSSCTPSFISLLSLLWMVQDT